MAVVGAGGLLFSAAIFGLTGLAAAVSGGDGAKGSGAEPEADGEAESTGGRSAQRVEIDVDGDDRGFSIAIELSPEDEALVTEFEECLAENGVVEEALDAKAEAGDLTEEDWETIDAALQACEPILGVGIAFGQGLGDLGRLGGFLFESLESCEDPGSGRSVARRPGRAT